MDYGALSRHPGTAIDAVLGDHELLRHILSFVPRAERAGRLSGVSREWRGVLFAHADLYRTLAVLGDTDTTLGPDAGAMSPADRISLWLKAHADQMCARRFVDEGALPVLPDRGQHPLCIGNCSRHLVAVERVFAVAGHAVLGFHFPRLTTLVLSSPAGYIEGWKEGWIFDTSKGLMTLMEKALCDTNVRATPYSVLERETRWQRAQTWLEWHRGNAPLQHVKICAANYGYRGNEALLQADYGYLFNPKDQPGLQSLDVAAYSWKGSVLEMVQGWSDDKRAKLVNLDIGCQCLDEAKQIVELLPNLRRLGWDKRDAGELDSHAFHLLDFCVAVGSQLDALYICLDGADIPTWGFDCFKVCNLKELVVRIEDGCEIVHQGPDGAWPATTEDVERMACRSMPNTIVSVMSWDGGDRGDGHHLPYNSGDPLHRALLPASKEEWHMTLGAHLHDPRVAGPFLSGLTHDFPIDLVYSPL
eukprot:CAMPEP_0119360262 /NCGR_PEP_ID=MMETSP1334-20130426/7929_1 /TAXON_ID=127549 /ORGANISM="Calcidiscus leptoporus, Strain RCC1130" /LENGTH=473 /DNA_ID=CAMNT_0007375081 /DNA_START=22 /DNA_END=1443 /DNA_ORIENTATION=+